MSGMRNRLAEQLSAADVAALDRLLEPGDEEFVLGRGDLVVRGTRTAWAARREKLASARQGRAGRGVAPIPRRVRRYRATHARHAVRRPAPPRSRLGDGQGRPDRHRDPVAVRHQLRYRLRTGSR